MQSAPKILKNLAIAKTPPNDVPIFEQCRDCIWALAARQMPKAPVSNGFPLAW